MSPGLSERQGLFQHFHGFKRGRRGESEPEPELEVASVQRASGESPSFSLVGGR